jgi:3',5'-cyclic AMP phosphodiesterase CpdA
MSLLLQFSDTHFGTEQPKVVEALVRLVDDLAPRVLVYSGDITQRARRAQFDAARHFCSRLGSRKMMVLPGNHDIPLFNLPGRIFRPYAGFTRAFGDDFQPVIETLNMVVIGVTTTRPWRHKNGQVSDEQIESVCARLRQTPRAKLRVVVTHQPVAVLREGDEHDRLRNADAAIMKWSDAGADVILGGHIHLPYVLALKTRYPALPRRLWCVQAGTAVSSRTREGIPNSVNVISYDANAPQDCEVFRYDYLAASDRFGRVDSFKLLPDRE